MRLMATVALVATASTVLGFAFAADAQAPRLRSSAVARAVVFKVPDANGLRLFLRDKDAKVYGSLEAVNSAVKFRFTADLRGTAGVRCRRGLASPSSAPGRRPSLSCPSRMKAMPDPDLEVAA